MATTFFAVLPLAHRSFLERGDLLGADRNSDIIGLPKREGIYRAAGPRAA
jgi:predicted secreted protein